MKKALSLILICLFLTACSNVSQFVDLKIKDVEVRAELAVNFKEKIQGLSGRENLENNQGMLFLYEQAGQYSFWMKDMNFSLDIIYINSDEIMEIFKNVPLKTDGEITGIFPVQTVDKVLEVNAGFCDLYDIQIGDKISFINN